MNDTWAGTRLRACSLLNYMSFAACHFLGHACSPPKGGHKLRRITFPLQSTQQVLSEKKLIFETIKVGAVPCNVILSSLAIYPQRNILPKRMDYWPLATFSKAFSQVMFKKLPKKGHLGNIVDGRNPCTAWHVWNPMKQKWDILHINWLAGFFPWTVWYSKLCVARWSHYLLITRSARICFFWIECHRVM